jgi:hypothetical protein
MLSIDIGFSYVAYAYISGNTVRYGLHSISVGHPSLTAQSINELLDEFGEIERVLVEQQEHEMYENYAPDHRSMWRPRFSGRDDRRP